MHSPPPTRTTTIWCSFEFKGFMLDEDIFDFIKSKGRQAALRDIIPSLANFWLYDIDIGLSVRRLPKPHAGPTPRPGMALPSPLERL